MTPGMLRHEVCWKPEATSNPHSLSLNGLTFDVDKWHQCDLARAFDRKRQSQLDLTFDVDKWHQGNLTRAFDR
ncbi:hypothetical protein [Chamaesiphon sp. VAR_48_metabat_403]|uniref:hypothetical protein n=1 Tax=Chamaesiphon sp. VAR_48_metabat_403 TaxID=2964700 RepID=UPI00286E58E1|nr:hypothetical protein [Chamaesiphon sp. VAR_48_metabat_403]